MVVNDSGDSGGLSEDLNSIILGRLEEIELLGRQTLKELASLVTIFVNTTGK